MIWLSKISCQSLNLKNTYSDWWIRIVFGNHDLKLIRLGCLVRFTISDLKRWKHFYISANMYGLELKWLSAEATKHCCNFFFFNLIWAFQWIYSRFQFQDACIPQQKFLSLSIELHLESQYLTLPSKLKINEETFCLLCECCELWITQGYLTASYSFAGHSLGWIPFKILWIYLLVSIW